MSSNPAPLGSTKNSKSPQEPPSSAPNGIGQSFFPTFSYVPNRNGKSQVAVCQQCK